MHGSQPEANDDLVYAVRYMLEVALVSSSELMF
jgi:hypothetical protein